MNLTTGHVFSFFWLEILVSICSNKFSRLLPKIDRPREESAREDLLPRLPEKTRPLSH